MTDFASKVLDRATLKQLTAEWRKAGHQIILTNGCFDVLHVGHVRYLHAAKALGGKLIVAINTDSTVRQLKGTGRPRIPEEEQRSAFTELYTTIKAGIEAYAVFSERARQRLRLSKN